jgi:hypothetical protein
MVINHQSSWDVLLHSDAPNAGVHLVKFMKKEKPYSPGRLFAPPLVLLKMLRELALTTI